MIIEINHTAENELSRESWSFEVLIRNGSNSSLNVRLDTWSRQSRASRRHKWMLNGEGWRRRSNDHHHHGYRRPAADVSLPDEVKNAVVIQIMKRIEFEGPVDPPPRGKY